MMTGEGGDTWTPAAVYTDANPVPLSEIQNGVVLPNETPQGLTRFGSTVVAAGKPRSTRLVLSSVTILVSPYTLAWADAPTLIIPMASITALHFVRLSPLPSSE